MTELIRFVVTKKKWLTLRKVMSWNGFFVRNNSKNRYNKKNNSKLEHHDNVTILCIMTHAEMLVNSLVSKLVRHLDKPLRYEIPTVRKFQLLK